MSVEACDKYFIEMMTKVANVVEDRYLVAVEGAMEWGRKHLPEVTARCDVDADHDLTALRNNGIFDEFKPKALDFCRARLELYKNHAAALEGVSTNV